MATEHAYRSPDSSRTRLLLQPLPWRTMLLDASEISEAHAMCSATRLPENRAADRAANRAHCPASLRDRQARAEKEDRRAFVHVDMRATPPYNPSRAAVTRRTATGFYPQLTLPTGEGAEHRAAAGV